MTPQGELDFRAKGVPRARRTDPATSKQAARSMRSAAQTQHAAILAVLRQHGDLTFVEIAGYLGCEPVQVARRLAELRELKLVERLPGTRPTPSGRDAHLVRAVR